MQALVETVFGNGAIHDDQEHEVILYLGYNL
jgi:hypothetical protein